MRDLIALDLQPLEDRLRLAFPNNHWDREALLANSDATELPLNHALRGVIRF